MPDWTRYPVRSVDLQHPLSRLSWRPPDARPPDVAGRRPRTHLMPSSLSSPAHPGFLLVLGLGWLCSLPARGVRAVLQAAGFDDLARRSGRPPSPSDSASGRILTDGLAAGEWAVRLIALAFDLLDLPAVSASSSCAPPNRGGTGRPGAAAASRSPPAAVLRHHHPGGRVGARRRDRPGSGFGIATGRTRSSSASSARWPSPAGSRSASAAPGRLGPAIEQPCRPVTPAQAERESAGEGDRTDDADDERVHHRGRDAELTQRDHDGEHPHGHLRDGRRGGRGCPPVAPAADRCTTVASALAARPPSTSDDQRDREVGQPQQQRAGAAPTPRGGPAGRTPRPGRSGGPPIGPAP